MSSFLPELPVAALSARLGLPEREAEGLVETLRRLGVRTFGALAALPTAQVADRFGAPGLRALRIARGEDELLVVHRRGSWEELSAEVELPEGTAGERLERALELLVDRLLAAPRRRERTLLTLRFGALLVGGGGWGVEQGLGRPTAEARALRSVLAPRLAELPAPALALRLRAVRFGPRAVEQGELTAPGEHSRHHRLGAALREVRAAEGAEALLRVLSVDDPSRVPERRAVLTPYPLR